jgi:hypothetical protein
MPFTRGTNLMCISLQTTCISDHPECGMYQLIPCFPYLKGTQQEVVRTNMKGLRDLLNDCRRRNVSYAPTDRVLTELDDDLQAMDSITQ